MKQNVKMNVLLLLQQMECLQYFSEGVFIKLYTKFVKEYKNSVEVANAIFDTIIQTSKPLPIVEEYDYFNN